MPQITLKAVKIAAERATVSAIPSKNTTTGLNHRLGVRNRAVTLLEGFFADDSPSTRRVIFNQAFVDCERDPRSAIEYEGSVAVFADRVVVTLLKHGCVGKGRHSLSLLIETMANARGRQTDADYAELPRLLDAGCALPTREEELRYLQALVAREDALAQLYSPLRGVVQSQHSNRLAPLLAAWQGHKDIALLLHQPRREPVEQAAHAPSASRQYDNILSAFADVKQAALLGVPGAGKSTTLRKLAVDTAQAALENPAAPLPLFVGLGFWRGEEDLSTFLVAQQPELGWAASALARQRRLILLLDGLNEVPAAQRKAKAEQVRRYLRCLPKDTPLIVSCRRDDYVGELELELDSLSLEPLTPQRVRAVLRHWLSGEAARIAPASADRLFWQLAGDERLASMLETWLAAGADEDAFWSLRDSGQAQAYAKTSAELALWRSHITNPRSLVRLAANPFMLTMLYVTWLQNQGALPRNRGDLFARFTDSLLSREGLIETGDEGQILRRDPKADLLLEGLARVAMAMQISRPVRALTTDPDEHDKDDIGVLTAIPRSDAVRLLNRASLLKIAEDASLLEGHDEIRFRHQLLQEYFTAISLRRLLAADELDAHRLWPAERWWVRSGWEEAAVLLAGLYSDDCSPVIRWLKDHQPEVAAQCVLESGAALAERDALLRELRDSWLPRLTDLEREPEPAGRAAIGRALGRLGIDDRPGVGLTAEGLPDIDWVEIDGGAFICQDGERRTFKTFYISRFPITHSQFQAFLDAEDGYASDHWWAGFEDAYRTPAEAVWPIANHPREAVSWHETVAFCDWLSHRMRLAIRLPTEWEWERAARGTDGCVYPWGKEYISGYANINEALDHVGPRSLARTSAVGIYPQATSPDGVLDLSGNVSEWCANEYAKPERTGRGGSESRAVRGGSWSLDLGYARGNYRYSRYPLYRTAADGFRVLCVSPIR